MATQSEIQTLINQIITNGNYSANEMRSLLTNMLEYHTVGAWTPVVSNSINLTLSNPNLTRFEKTVNDVTLYGSFTGTLAGGQTSGFLNIDMGEALRPTADFGGVYDVVAVMSRTDAEFTGLHYIVSATGTKLLKLGLADTSAGAAIDFTFIIKYSIS